LRLLAALLLVAAPAAASQDDLYAATIPSLGLAGAGSLLEDGGAGAINQPAAIGFGAGDFMRLGGLAGQVWLSEVEGLTRLDGGGPAPEVAVQPGGVTIDLVKNLGPWLRGGAWVVASLPNLYHHDTKDPWVPYSMRWQSRYGRTLAAASLAGKIPVRGVPGGSRSIEHIHQGGLWLGVGLSVRPRGIIDVDLDLIGRDDGADGRIDVVLSNVDLIARPVIRPEASIAFDLGTAHAALVGYRVGVAYRSESITRIDPIGLDILVDGLEELNPLFSLVERIQAQVFLGLVDFYDPHQVRISFAADQLRWAATVDVQWNDWSRLDPSFGQVVGGLEGEEGFLDLVLKGADGDNVIDFPVQTARDTEGAGFHDAWDLALGGELRPPGVPLPRADQLLELTIRLGYRIQGGAVTPGDGRAAILDSDVHTIGFGLGLAGPAPPTFAGPIRLDWGVQALRMVGLDLPKNAATGSTEADFPVAWEAGAQWGGGWSVVSGASLGMHF